MEKIIGMAYARVSTEDQAEYSPDVQIEDILDYANKHHIFIPPEFIFIDEGISGKSANNRPAFMDMIKKARKKSNRVEVILVHKYDRFSRKKDDAVLYKALLKKDGVKVISVKEPIPEDDKFAVIYESMLEAMAEYYSLNLAEEVKKTMVKKAERGEYQSTAPFGYRNENKSLVVVPEEASIVKMIFDKYLDNVPVLQITDIINTMGIKTHRGNVFENRTVQYILNNPVYCGYVRWSPAGRIRRDFYNKNAIVSKSSHEPIIDMETFQKASQKWIAGRRKSSPHQRPAIEGKHWLSGLIKCSSCGRSLVISYWNKKGGFSMQCGGYNHGQCKVSHYLTSQLFIPAFLGELKKIVNNNTSDYLLHFTSVKPDNNEDEINKILLLKAKSRLKKAKEAYLAGVDTLEEYKQNKQSIDFEISALEEKLEKKEKRSISPLQNQEYIAKLNYLYNILMDEDVSTDVKKHSIREMVEKIIFDRENNMFELFLFDF